MSQHFELRVCVGASITLMVGRDHVSDKKLISDDKNPDFSRVSVCRATPLQCFRHDHAGLRQFQ